jgi:hypothetical protein
VKLDLNGTKEKKHIAWGNGVGKGWSSICTSGGTEADNGASGRVDREKCSWDDWEGERVGIGAGTAAGTRQVLQSSLDSGTMVAVKTAFSCGGGGVVNNRHLNRDETLPVWR